MKNLIRVLSASILSLFALASESATVVLDNSLNCSMGNAINGIAVTDVTGNAGGASDCWGTYDGNDPGPGGSFDLDGTIFDYVARDNADTGLEGSDIGLEVDFGSSSGTWSFDSAKFSPTEFIIVLKASNSPGYAAWLFEGDDAASDAGTWLVAWTNENGEAHDLSHLSIYETSEVPVPAAALLFGSGLLGIVGVARRKNHA